MRWPAIDDRATIEPPPERAIAGAAWRITDHVPVMFSVSVWSHPSRSTSTSGPAVAAPPALATTMSSRAVLVARRGDGGGDVVLGRDVGGDGAGRAADRRDGVVEHVAAPPADRHRRPVGGQPAGAAEPDAGAAAGHQRVHPGQRAGLVHHRVRSSGDSTLSR